MSDRNELRIEDGALIVTPRGMDKVWGFRKQVVVPLAVISDVAVERNPRRVPSGLRGPGLEAFGKKAGTFHPRGEQHYWNFSGRGEVLMIDIRGRKPFDRLYLSVADAEASRLLILEVQQQV